MPSCYRGIFAALVGLVLVGASPPGQSGQREQAQSRASVEQSLRDISTALQEANKPDETTKPCPKDQDDRSSDLCAQWKAADAASASAVWTERTFWLGLFGLVVGIATFTAAFAAAVYAKKAADHTGTSNEIAADTAQRQLRAYLMVSTVSFGGLAEARTTPKFDFRLTNCGQTPAIKLRGHLAAYVEAWGHKPKLLSQRALKKFPLMAVGANGEVGAFWRLVTTTNTQREAFRRKEAYLFVVASHIYEDVFGNRYRTDHIYRSRGPEEDSMDPLLDRERLIGKATITPSNDKHQQERR